MASTEKHVTSVIWGFDDDNLGFNAYNRNDRRRYDVPTCAQNYAFLCKQQLQLAYPKAEVEVVYQVNPEDESELLPNTVKTHVTISDDWKNKDFDPNFDDVEIYDDSYEIEQVEIICTKAYEPIEGWLEEKKWNSIVDLSKRTQVPVSIIRLACQQKLIQDYWIDEGVWKVLRQDFTVFSEKINALIEKDVLAITMDDCHAYSIQGLMVTDFFNTYQMIPDTQYWFIKWDWLQLPSIYQAHNSVVMLEHDDSQLILTLHFFNSTNRLEGSNWTFTAFAEALISETSKHTNIEADLQEYQQLQGEIESIQIKCKYVCYPQQSLSEQIEQSVTKMRQITQDAKIVLDGGIRWNKDYERKGNEALFRDEVLDPLLRNLKYEEVRNRHGKKEYGKDFTFAEVTKFGKLLRYGLQAKAGGISGAANSNDIEILVRQIKLAFLMPYREPVTDPQEQYIAVYIIAISGEFTENAQEIIMKSVNASRDGQIFFWDKSDIQNLIKKLWPR